LGNLKIIFVNYREEVFETKIAVILQWIGFLLVTVGTSVILLNEPEVNDAMYALYLIVGLLLIIIGNMLVKSSKIGTFALCMTLLSVITYYYIDKGLLFKVFITISVFLVLIKFFFYLKKSKEISVSK